MNPIRCHLVLFLAGAALFSAPSSAQEHAQQMALRTQELPDQQPQPSKTATPVYPEVLKREGVQGDAFIKLSINDKGKVDSARVLRTSHEAFGQAAKEAAMKWEFSPAMKNGKPIRTEVVLPFKFALAGDDEFSGLITSATDILRGKLTQKEATQIDPEAYAVVGHTYAPLRSFLFDKTPPATLIEGEKTNVVYSSLKSDDAKKTVVLMLKTGASKTKADHFHTIVFMKSSDGLWKIRSWHASE